MAWATFDDDFAGHPKVVKAGGEPAGWLYFCAVLYCRKHFTGGFIAMDALASLPVKGDLKKRIDGLVDAGLWERLDGGFQVHDYHVMYPNEVREKAKRADTLAKRRIAGRAGGLASASKRGSFASTDAEANRSAPFKQPLQNKTSTDAQPLNRQGMDKEVLASNPEGRRPGGGDRREPPMDEWARELVNLYPAQGRLAFAIVERALFPVLTEGGVDPWQAWDELKARLEAHKRSHQWRVKGMVPRLDRYLFDGHHLQVLSESAPGVAPGRTGAAPAGKYEGLERS